MTNYYTCERCRKTNLLFNDGKIIIPKAHEYAYLCKLCYSKWRSLLESRKKHAKFSWRDTWEEFLKSVVIKEVVVFT